MIRRLFIALAAVSWLLYGSGCVPIPNTRVEGEGIKAYIIDAGTKLPVAKATIRDPVYGMSTTTALDGGFFLKPHVQSHWGYLFGPISYPIWPFTYDVAPLGRRFRVEAAGYVSRDFEVGIGQTQDRDIRFADSSRDVLIGPPLSIERMSPATGDETSTRPTVNQPTAAEQEMERAIERGTVGS